MCFLGVFILAVINILINIGILISPSFLFPHLDSEGQTGWVLMLLIADIWMGVGARTDTRLLLLPWLVFYMIYMVFTCIFKLYLLIGYAYLIQEARCNCNQQ